MMTTQETTPTLPDFDPISIPETIPMRRTVTLLSMRGEFVAKKIIFSYTVCPDVLTWQGRTFIRTSAHDYFYTEAISQPIHD